MKKRKENFSNPNLNKGRGKRRAAVSKRNGNFKRNGNLIKEE